MSSYPEQSRRAHAERSTAAAELEGRACEFIKRNGEVRAVDVAQGLLRVAGQRGVSLATHLLNRLWDAGRLQSELKVNPLSGQRARYYRVTGGSP